MPDLARRRKKDLVWLNVADEVSTLSTCLSGQVGAVVVRADGTVASVGFAGTPRGTAHCGALGGCLPGGDSKCTRTIHAERNALSWAREDLTGATLFITRRPCYDCAAQAVNLGIARIIWRPGPPDRRLAPETTRLLLEAGVSFCVLNKDGGP